MLEIGWDVCERAGSLGSLGSDGLRSLDVIHLASALTLAEDLEGVVTYDARPAGGATELGLRVLAPT